MRKLQPLAIAALVGVLASSSLAASDPPAGSYLLPLLGAPIPAGSGPSATFLDAPWADRFNPAASGAQQRPVLDIGYGLLSDFGIQGLGTAINLGFDLPQPYGVWNGGLYFVSTPGSMTDLPLGTLAQLRGGISKDLFPNFLVGAALDTSFGWNQDYGFGLCLDLGVIHKLGDLGFLKDFRYGAVLANIGKGYSTAASTWAVQAPFTLSGGARALLIRSDEFKIGAGLDLSLPSFIDLGLGLSGSLVWRDMLTLRLGWGFPSVRELAGGAKKNLLPSLAFMGTFPLSGLKDDSFMAQQGWDKSELRPALAVTPLYGSVYSISTGLTLPLGVVDQKGPDISAQFPTTDWGPWYLSPNADGKLDILDIPIHIVDQRYIASYQMAISPSGQAEPVRTIANKESRPENEGFTGLWNRLLYVKTGLPVPEKLMWNGFGDGGERVPDGDYEVRISAIDDNDNRSEVGPFPVTVDTTPPLAELAVADGVMIFSPDGDGSKDTITLKQQGSVEDLWTLKVLNAAGTAVRSSLYKNAGPSDFIWDGKSDAGTVVPDGVYSFSLASTDRAANPFMKRLENVVVNTQQPPVNIMIDASVFSPNGDRVQDSLGLRPSVPVRTGLVSWKISILDKARREVFSLGSTNPAAIPERFLFDGRGLDGKNLPEGSYQARLAANYQNGFGPVALSPSFVLDVTAPVASVRTDRVAFNSAGSEGQNRVNFTQSGSEEELWTGEILAANGRVSRSWNWNQKPAPVLAWDGSDDAGAAVPDGDYSYRLRSKDRAGNRYQSPEIPVALDTEKKTARLVTDLRAFSPNGDGIKDVLALGDTVQALDRVKGWKLGLYPAPEAGQHVDTTKPLKSWAGTNVIPPGFSWTGTKSDGSKAQDGRYVALLEVRWANDDAVEAQTLPILLDTVAPSISVSAFPLDFAPNEDSLQKTTTISQKAVPGDNWEARLLSTSGNPVRTWSWKGQVESLVWDGSDDSGNTVVNGSYRYEIVSTDEAGNAGRAQVSAIRVDARKPQVSVTASAPGLSPNGDGVFDTITFALDHDQGVREGISNWTLNILDASGAESLSVSGSRENIPETYVWKGLSASGTLVEGLYKARLTIMYTNGNHPVATSPNFVLDVTAPVATVTADRSAFNPAGKEAQSHVTFTQSGSEEQRWAAEILASDGSVQRSWSWKDGPEASLVWDGTNDDGAPVLDGSYFYRLRSQDRAGNSYQSPVFPVALDTEKKTARLGSDLRAFSPNGDGIKDVLALSDTVPGSNRVKGWKLAIYPAPESGQQADRTRAIRTWSGTTSILPAFTWIGDRDDGLKAPEGRYVAILEVSWANDDTAEAQTLPILLDTVSPALSASAFPLLFSPNPESRHRTSKIVQRAVPGDDWEGQLLDSKGNALRSWSWKGQVEDLVWDATDSAGNRVADGSYRYEVSSTDSAGNATRVVIPSIAVDARQAQVFVTASAPGLSPNNDGVMDDVSFSLLVNLRDGVSEWRFSILDSAGSERVSFSGADSDVPSRLSWNGKNSDGQVVEGAYTGLFRIDYSKGDRVESKTGTIIVDITPPAVELGLSPDFFSPDNDGVDDELTMRIAVKDKSELTAWKLDINEVSVEETPGSKPKERLFASWSGKGVPAGVITWDGKSSKGETVESATDYNLRFGIADVYGNRSELNGKVAVDVLVIREADKLKIKVPSIVFRANAADFNGLDAATVSKNSRVIARIAEILNKFRGYGIAIEGHANSIGKIYGYSAAKVEAEEKGELLPLSTDRAELVRKMLVAAGVDAKRLSVLGMGSGRPVVDFKDAVNRWKNRRVEFILIKAAASGGSGE